MKHRPDEVEKLVHQAGLWGFGLARWRAERLIDYATLLSSYDEANVIGAKTERAILDDHISDSLSCLLFEPLRRAGSLVDVGSGAGLPGVPLGLALGGIDVMLIESTAKKVKFIESAASAMNMTNLRVLSERAELVGRSDLYREYFDVATARALAPLDVLAEYCLPLVKVGGHVVAMKGRVQEDEIQSGKAALEVLGGELSTIVEVTRPPEYERKHRNLVILKKTSRTPEKYPRRVGVPAKNPLGRKVENR